LGQNVFVGSTAVVGAGCKVANNVSLYDSVHLEEDVFVGPSAVFTNVKTPRAFISRKDAYAVTHVGRGASIGANATIVCGCRIGPYALVGAGAVVTRDVPAFALVMGVPARRRGWVCTCGATLPPFSKGRAQIAACPACAQTLQRTGDTVRVADDSGGRPARTRTKAKITREAAPASRQS
jgi:UDP-2-acetamido-3-amino-2,3-dideoxy-glucuronate N-acetyltransferase